MEDRAIIYERKEEKGEEGEKEGEVKKCSTNIGKLKSKIAQMPSGGTGQQKKILRVERYLGEARTAVENNDIKACFEAFKKAKKEIKP